VRILGIVTGSQAALKLMHLNIGIDRSAQFII
jgi:hypothetical protein